MITKFSDTYLLAEVLRTIASLVVVFEKDGKVVLFNEACQKLSGYEEEEILGREIWDLLIPEGEREGVAKAFNGLRAGDFPATYENYWVSRDGEWRKISWSNSAMVDGEGEVEYVIATGLDVTQRRQAEAAERAEAVREAAERARESARLSDSVFSGIVDLSADGIISVDGDLIIRQFNKGAEEIFGYNLEEVLGSSLNELLPEKSRALHDGHVKGFRDEERPAKRMGERGQIYGMRKNGEIFPAEASISKQMIDGEWIFTAVVRDVTEQRQSEEELARKNQELKRSNSDLENFATVASHDLQEPLRKIQAFGDRLESRYGEDLPERGKDYLHRMQSAAGRMSTLIQDLLAFSRVTTRAQPFERLNLGEVIEKVLSDLEIRLEQSGGRVELAEMPFLDADPLQMRLLFQNLISNALKFRREEEPPVVKISAEKRGERVMISVEDNGVGFDEKYLDRIFDVFQRLHGRGTFEGTGMGLAIARKIVERHEGELTAKSIPEKGSTFLIDLPLRQRGRKGEDEQ